MRDLAARTELSYGYIDKIEKAKGQRVDVTLVSRLAEALGLPLSELLGREATGVIDYSDAAFIEFRREWELLPVSERGLVLEMMRVVRLYARIQEAGQQDVRVLASGSEAPGEVKGRPAAG